MARASIGLNIAPWATDSGAVRATLESLRISRSNGLPLAFVRDRFPTVGLLNTILSELHSVLSDMGRTGVLEWDSRVPGLFSRAIVLGSDGIIYQAHRAGAHNVDPTTDLIQDCWRPLSESPIQATTGTAGIFSFAAETDRSENVVATPENLGDQAGGISSGTVLEDGVVSAASLTGGVLTLERSFGLSDLTETLTPLVSQFIAPLASPVLAGEPRASEPGSASNSQQIVTTRWTREHVGDTLPAASDTQAGVFRLANQSDTDAGRGSGAITPAVLASRLTNPFGRRGGKGDPGDQPLTAPQGIDGDEGPEGELFVRYAGRIRLTELNTWQYFSNVTISTNAYIGASLQGAMAYDDRNDYRYNPRWYIHTDSIGTANSVTVAPPPPIADRQVAPVMSDGRETFPQPAGAITRLRWAIPLDAQGRVINRGRNYTGGNQIPVRLIIQRVLDSNGGGIWAFVALIRRLQETNIQDRVYRYSTNFTDEDRTTITIALMQSDPNNISDADVLRWTQYDIMEVLV